ncbi:MAG: hypothetical protein QG639_763 [Patescibacteria group bacterium]|nr:hypothetical protein [Patescibacteria group bacterium]
MNPLQILIDAGEINAEQAEQVVRLVEEENKSIELALIEIGVTEEKLRQIFSD